MDLALAKFGGQLIHREQGGAGKEAEADARTSKNWRSSYDLKGWMTDADLPRYTRPIKWHSPKSGNHLSLRARAVPEGTDPSSALVCVGFPPRSFLIPADRQLARARPQGNPT